MHGTLGIIHGARGLTDERDFGVVLHLILGAGSPLELFKTCNTLKVENIGIGTIKTCGLESAMEVDK